MRLIPGKTKVQTELFRGVTLWDILIAGISLVMVLLLLMSSVPGKYIICLVIFFIAAVLLIRLDAEPNYVMVLHMLRHYSYKRRYARVYDDEMLRQKGSGEIGEVFLDQYREAGKTEEKEEEKPVEQKDKDYISEKELIKRENQILKSRKSTEEEKNAVWLARAERSAAKKRARSEARSEKEANADYEFMENIIPFTGINEDLIEYGGKYYGAVIEIDPVEFRFFGQHRRDRSIESGVGRVLRSIHSGYAANIVKIERPIIYDNYLIKEQAKLDHIRKSFESGLMDEEEFKARIEIENERIADLKSLCTDKQVITPFYYLVLFESDKKQLELQVKFALDMLIKGEMTVRRLNTKELAVFLKYTNQIDFNEREIVNYQPEDYIQWAMPQKVFVKARTVEVNEIVTHNFRVVNYPAWVGDAWLAGVLSLPATKVVVKCSPIERGKAIRSIDRSLQELRGQYYATGIDSKRIELEGHIDTLSNLLVTLQNEGEELLMCNIYVTAYDRQLTRINKALEEWPSLLPEISGLKKTVRRTWQESNFRLNSNDFNQMSAFIGSQISAYDPEASQGRGIPSNSMAAGYPWIYAHISDEGGFKLGSSDGVPVFIDFFRRDNERVNSNMVIIGKTGSGKSYATKSILANLASEDAKIFILDPENEYSELAQNLHGKVINVANSSLGRLNPFHIITALEDDEEGGTAAGSYAIHLQFLEEFYRQILPDIDKDSLEYLNNLTERLYTNRGITPETDLSKLRPEDYPVFDDLYDAVLEEFERTDNEYIRSLLRTLVNYVAKFASGGRNSNIWNGPSTVTTDENFTVFNFQSMLANRNTTIANAQMLLVLKYIDNEIIKNRDYNTKYGLSRKIVVVIDEAHVFIDTKFPVALDFMFQLAKRIRKYNGMQIVITQNIKDFVGSEEIARKSTAIINACQYSFIFSLAPNDMHDLCRLYEKAGGINESEQEQIIQAPRGQAFTVMSAFSRSTFRVEVPKHMVDMFQERDYISSYYTGTDGAAAWDDFVGESRSLNAANLKSNRKTAAAVKPVEDVPKQRKNRVSFAEISEEEAEELLRRSNAGNDEKTEIRADKEEPDIYDEWESEDIPDHDDLIDTGKPVKVLKKYQGSVSAAAEEVRQAVPLVDYVAMMDNIRQQVLTEVMSEIGERTVEDTGAVRMASGDSPAAAGTERYHTYASSDDEPVSIDSLEAVPLTEEDYEPEEEEFDAFGFDELYLSDEEESESGTGELSDDGDLFSENIFDEDEDTEEDEEEEDEEDEEEDDLPDLDVETEPDFDEDDPLIADLAAYESDEEEDEEEEEDFDFSSLFDIDDEEEETEEETDFDIMSLFSSETTQAAGSKTADKPAQIEDISEIVAPGDVADVTLEELGEVVAWLRRKKRKQAQTGEAAN